MHRTSGQLAHNIVLLTGTHQQGYTCLIHNWHDLALLGLALLELWVRQLECVLDIDRRGDCTARQGKCCAGNGCQLNSPHLQQAILATSLANLWEGTTYHEVKVPHYLFIL